MGGEMNGNFIPDDQMPGIPGATDEGIAAEIVTFAEFPVGLITMGVTSDDGFRTQAGSIGNPAAGLLLGESEFASTNIFRFVVQNAGVYPLRTIWFENNGAAHIEWFTVKADGTNVLLNDTANGGFRTYRVGVAPSSFQVAIQKVSGQIVITWSEPGTVLQESTNLTTWSNLASATSPYQTAPGPRTAVFYRLVK
jgi:hypothetical protein